MVWRLHDLDGGSPGTCLSFPLDTGDFVTYRIRQLCHGAHAHDPARPRANGKSSCILHVNEGELSLRISSCRTWQRVS